MAGGGGEERRRAAGLVLTLAAMLALVGFQAYLTLARPAGRAGTARLVPEPREAAPARRNAMPPRGAERPPPRSQSPGDAPEASPARPASPSSGWLALDRAYRRLAAGDVAAAERAFERALALGHEPERAALELGWIAKRRGDGGLARERFGAVARGRDADLAALARAELRLLEEREAIAPATHASRPLTLGAPAGPGHLEDGRPGDEGADRGLAPADLDPARASPSRALALAPASAAHARRAPEPLSARRDAWTVDLYAETVGWRRVGGPAGTSELVPTFRLRALRGLPLDRDLSVYGFAQVTRELGSIEVAGGRPLLHADDAAMLGAGLLLRVAAGRAGLFAQAGSAVATAPGRAGEVRLDARAGAFLAADTARCWPAPAAGLRLRLDPCAELYGEAVYVSRFDHDVLALARGRAGATLLAAGPVALGVLAEARAVADRNGDWYDNLGEVGAGLRARLLAPFRLDVTATAVAGRYLGRAGRDPLPADLGYADLRLLAATFVEF